MVGMCAPCSTGQLSQAPLTTLTQVGEKLKTFFGQNMMIMVIIFLPGESPLEVAQTGKFKDIVRLLKEKEDKELNPISEVGNINFETPSCFRFIFCSLLLSYFKLFLSQSLGERTDKKNDKTKKKKEVKGSKKKKECAEETISIGDEKKESGGDLFGDTVGPGETHRWTCR